jgi:hypothetical protein
MKQDLASGVAPFTQDAQQVGMAWTGWGWDLKMGDFLNSGHLDVVQTDGFVKGKTGRWPWLQEMAMSNDDLYTNPASWPLVEPGDDIAGHQCIAFWAKAPGNAYVNVTKQLGLCVPTPTRGIATADTRADGALDFAVARQWGPPAFYANQSPHRGYYLGLELYRPSVGGGPPGVGLEGLGSRPTGRRSDLHPGHTQIAQLDGAAHGEVELRVYFGGWLRPVTHLRWRAGGQLISRSHGYHGTHDLVLASTVRGAGR